MLVPLEKTGTSEDLTTALALSRRMRSLEDLNTSAHSSLLRVDLPRGGGGGLLGRFFAASNGGCCSERRETCGLGDSGGFDVGYC